MNEVNYIQKTLPVQLIDTNKGQIPRVPKNGRVIKKERLDALVDVLEKNIHTLDVFEIIVYPFEGRYVAIGGNMRLRACKKIGTQNLLCKVLSEDTPKERLVEIALKDNATFSQIDFELMKDSWSVDEVLNCGVDLSGIENPEEFFGAQESWDEFDRFAELSSDNEEEEEEPETDNSQEEYDEGTENDSEEEPYDYSKDEDDNPDDYDDKNDPALPMQNHCQPKPANTDNVKQKEERDRIIVVYLASQKDKMEKIIGTPVTSGGVTLEHILEGRAHKDTKESVKENDTEGE